MFRNCTITGNDELEVNAGYLGRPWGQDARVTFLNTKINGSYIKDEGWFDMSGNKQKKQTIKNIILFTQMEQQLICLRELQEL